jgi:CIC family chloride channel protein
MNVSGRRVLLGLFIGAGVASGLAAVGFHAYVELSRSWLIEWTLEQRGWLRVLLIVGTPAAVAALLGYLVQRFVPVAAGANLARVRRSYSEDPGFLDPKTVVATFALTPVSLGSGAPLGPEGPIVVVSSGVSVWLARLLKFPRKVQRGMIPVGTAAGIAAIFRTPITGIVFAIEELLGTTSRGVLAGAIVAAVAAAVVERTILGAERILPVTAATWTSPWEMIGFTIVGIVAGTVSGAIVRTVIALRRRWRAVMPSMPARGALAGALVGLIGLIQPAILGVGYDVTSLFIRGGGSATYAGTAFAAKAVAFTIAASAGLLGGTFAPSLFIGSALGATVGQVGALIVTRGVDPGAYALAGMGAYFAGTLRCPIAAVLIVLELTNDYGLVVPVMLTVVVSTAVSRIISPHSIEEDQLFREGYRGLAERRDPIAALAVADVMTRSPIAFRADTTLAAIVEATREVRHRLYPITDANGLLLGVIEGASLAERVRNSTLDATASDIMRKVSLVARPDELVHDVLTRMAAAGVERCPVVGDDNTLAGFLSPSDLVRARFRRTDVDGTWGP